MSEIDDLRAELAELRRIPTPRNDAFERMLARLYTEAEELRQMLRPEIRLDVATPEVHVAAPEVRVDVPDQSAALAQLAAVMQELIGAIVAKETQVTVNVPTQPVTLTMEMPAEQPEPPKTITFKRDGNGRILEATVRED